MQTAVAHAPLESELLAYQRTVGNLAVATLLPVQREDKPKVPPPPYLVAFTFLGQGCGAGINPVLRDRLIAVETHLTTRFAALPDAQKTKPGSNEPAATHIEWLGIREPHIGWRSLAGLHGSGSAIDIAIHTNPYIATRTFDKKGNPQYGGEAAGAGLAKQREDAVAVYDRAMKFTRLALESPEQADVSVRGGRDVSPRAGGTGIKRGPGADRETTEHVYARFKAASDALSKYLSLAFHNPESVQINRPPVQNLDKITLDELFRRIPPSERKNLDQAVDDIRAFIADDRFATTHPDGPFVGQERDIFFQMLKDYEMVRIPMVYGTPSATPGSTRNPLRGFLNLRVELVTALTDVGLLDWGASDFAQESGDMQHFDLGTHAFTAV